MVVSTLTRPLYRGSATRSYPQTSAGRELPKERYFPFYNLPFELRSLIYESLVPDVEIPYARYQIYRHLRADGGLCAPALFRASRAIHDELLEAWYGNSKAVYCMLIEQSHLEFLNQRFSSSPNIQVPRALRYIRSLKITLIADHLPKPLDPSSDFYSECCTQSRRGNPARVSGVPNFLAAVTENLQPGQCALKKLRLDLIGLDLFYYHAQGPERLKQSLEINLCYFRKIRGLQAVRITFRLTHIWNPETRDRVTKVERKQFCRDAMPFVLQLRAEMKSPVLIQRLS